MLLGHLFLQKGNCEITQLFPSLCHILGAIYLLKFGFQL